MVMQILLFFMRLSNLSLFFSIIWLFYFYCLPLLHNRVKRLQHPRCTCPLAVGCWLLAVGCWLLAVGYWLLAVGCWLLAVGYWLLAIGYWLLAIGFWRSALNSKILNTKL